MTGDRRLVLRREQLAGLESDDLVRVVAASHVPTNCTCWSPVCDLTHAACG